MSRTDARTLLALLAALVAAMLLVAFVPHTPSKAGSVELPAPSIEFSADGEARMSTEEGAVIRYTLDGSMPSATSPVFEEPLVPQVENSVDHLINAQPTSIQWRHPMGDFPRGVSVRVAVTTTSGRVGSSAACAAGDRATSRDADSSDRRRTGKDI